MFLLLMVAVTHNITMNPCFSLSLILTVHDFTPFFLNAMFWKVRRVWYASVKSCEGVAFIVQTDTSKIFLHMYQKAFVQY
jgi:hypothetical protein